MPRKKSVKKAAQEFVNKTIQLQRFCNSVQAAELSAHELSWAYEGALIKLHAAFERLILHALVGAINNDTSLLTSASGARFPKHLTDEACEYIVTGGGYFDYRGRDGLIKTLKGFLEPRPTGAAKPKAKPAKKKSSQPAPPKAKPHYLVTVVSDKAYEGTLDKMIALRNFAAHESRQSKRKAREAVGVNLGSAGSWLKRRGRFNQFVKDLTALARAIEAKAPY